MPNLLRVFRKVSNLTGTRPSLTQLVDLPRSCSPKLCLCKSESEEGADSTVSLFHLPYTSKTPTAATGPQGPLWPRHTPQRTQTHGRCSSFLGFSPSLSQKQIALRSTWMTASD